MRGWPRPWGSHRAEEVPAHASARHWRPLRLTSAVGLHGLPAAAGPIAQARRHVLPSLALSGLHRLQLWGPEQRSGHASPRTGLAQGASHSGHDPAPSTRSLKPQASGGSLQGLKVLKGLKGHIQEADPLTCRACQQHRKSERTHSEKMPSLAHTPRQGSDSPQVPDPGTDGKWLCTRVTRIELQCVCARVHVHVQTHACKHSKLVRTDTLRERPSPLTPRNVLTPAAVLTRGSHKPQRGETGDVTGRAPTCSFSHKQRWAVATALLLCGR